MPFNYEIHDDNGTLMKGHAIQVIYQWSAMWRLIPMSDKDYLKFKSTNKIKKWKGKLRLVEVIEEVNISSGQNKLPDYSS